MKNVLLVTVDSLRADHVGYHGYERDVTPYIDEYAEEGSRFMNAFAHSGGTKISFPSILSSVDPLMYGGHRSGVSEDQTLISEVFDEAGYTTAAFHSNLWLSEDFDYHRGFDVFFDSKDNPSLMQRARWYVKNNLSGPLFKLLKKTYDFAESSAGINVGSFHKPGDEITDMALEHVTDTRDDSGHFLWVHYMDVHHPFLPPEEYQLEFRDSVVSDRESIKLRRKMMEEPDEVTEEELQTVMDLYDAEILFNDEQIHRLVEGVRDSWGETLFVLTADHGEHFVERGALSGHQFYDEKIHVPLLVNGWNDSGEYEQLVGLMDIPPTLADYAGLDIPDSYRGYSLLPLVEEGVWPRESILGGKGVGEPEFQYRDSRWKYIRRYGDKQDELYDLEADPEETNNVHDEHPSVVDEIRDEIEEYEDEIAETQKESEEVQMEEHVKERLRNLGYNE